MMMAVSSQNQQRINSRFFARYREKFSHAMSENQSGDKNSQFGTIWISNKELKINKKVKKSNFYSDGWVIGRNCWLKEDRLEKRKIDRGLSKIKREEKSTNLEEETKYYWELFKNGDYYSLRDFAKKEYLKSHVSLTKNFRRFIPDFSAVERKRYK